MKYRSFIILFAMNLGHWYNAIYVLILNDIGVQWVALGAFDDPHELCDRTSDPTTRQTMQVSNGC